MSTMFSSSSGLNKSEITVISTNQILSGYKDYDSNGNLLTGSNAGYDAGVTQGEANMKSGVTVTGASQVISGYKARTSDGTLVTGSDAGYNAGVNQGHADRDSGVTITDASHILSGYKGRNSSGTLLTGTAVNPSGAKSITANGNGQDVTAYATVNVSVPNSNSGTYTFASGDTGDTKDLGATNSYRYVNATNVYNKGKADGRPEMFVKTFHLTSVDSATQCSGWSGYVGYNAFMLRADNILGGTSNEGFNLDYAMDMNNGWHRLIINGDGAKFNDSDGAWVKVLLVYQL